MLRYFIYLFWIAILCSCSVKDSNYVNWEEYLGDSERSHYTTLSDINLDNVNDLEVAWTYESSDTGQMQMNPIIVDGTLYGVSSTLNAFAIDAATGQEKWIYGDREKSWHNSRGVSYWQKGNDRRILFTQGENLIALNAEDGSLVKSFGNQGLQDLRTGFPEHAKNRFITSNTPGAIYNDLIIMPYRLSEGADAAPGDIKAYNIVDGSLAWTFHVIPYPGEKGYESWENEDAYKNTEGIGAGNCWAGITVDRESGVLYVPTGSFAPDFYGGHRPGDNLYSNCLLALNANSGKLLWHQQLVHHDIWDRDLPAPPNLLTIRKDGKNVEVVAQITKQGYVFTFDKKTGEPIYSIEEVAMPSSNLEKSWPTQPIPTLPGAFARRSDEITESDFSPYAPNRKEIIDIIRNANKDFYNPPDTTPTLILPGYDGAAEWGGAGVDPKNGIIYINSNEMAWLLKLEKTPDVIRDSIEMGAFIYTSLCETCHQSDLKGDEASGYPSLIGITDRLEKMEILNIINKGKGKMPGFQSYGVDEKEAVIDFISGKEGKKYLPKKSVNQKHNLPYRHTGYNKFLDANGLPAISPPWGTLNAIDLNTGEFLWKNTFGEIDSLMQLGYPPTGSENYGGPIITENGLLIIAATKDAKARIYNRHSGELIWSDKLPAASFATPATYMINGKQYIVFACGGEKLNTEPGNKLVAYALKN